MPIRVSKDGRRFENADGTPFFYLADTAWMLLNSVSKEDTEYYLQVRAEQGFTVIAMVALAEIGSLRVPNKEGELPLLDLDTVQPNPAYFDHIEYVVSRAADYGMQVALLPTWGDKVQPWNDGKDGIFSPAFNNQGRQRAMAKAYGYGAWIARRFAGHDNIIWTNGGDRGPSGPDHEITGQDYWDIWNALACGLQSASGVEQDNMCGTTRTPADAGKSPLIGFHPPGGYSSSYWFHHCEWLAFNQIQSGHWSREIDNYAMINQDYRRLPVKPCFDGEPCYEAHPVQYRPELGEFNDYDCRMKAYHALFAGAAGHTYGANGVFQFHDLNEPDFFGASLNWKKALQLPGARQMAHVRRLFEDISRGSRFAPANGFVLTDTRSGVDAVYSLKDVDSRRALVYSTSGKPFIADLAQLSAGTITARWYSPRTGRYRPVDTPLSHAPQAFVPPIADEEDEEAARNRPTWLPRTGNDWILRVEAN